MEINFINSFKSTRGGFKHETKVSINSTIVHKTECHYINRTWERYTYQSVMKKALHELIEKETQKLRNEIKERTGKKRLPKDLPVSNLLLFNLRKKLSEL